MYEYAAWDAFFEKGGRRESRCCTRRQAAIGPAVIGLVGNPSLCPAFRVRRGRGRKNGFMTGRARRATRPTPSKFRRPSGDGRRLQLDGERAGASLAVRFALRSPDLATLARSSL